jgi:hypothetical protein
MLHPLSDSCVGGGLNWQVNVAGKEIAERAIGLFPPSSLPSPGSLSSSAAGLPSKPVYSTPLLAPVTFLLSLRCSLPSTVVGRLQLQVCLKCCSLLRSHRTSRELCSSIRGRNLFERHGDSSIQMLEKGQGDRLRYGVRASEAAPSVPGRRRATSILEMDNLSILLDHELLFVVDSCERKRWRGQEEDVVSKRSTLSLLSERGTTHETSRWRIAREGYPIDTCR